MKLSEAILLGSINTVQAYDTLYDGKGGACALGAALDAMNITISQASKTWPYLNDINKSICPECMLTYNQRRAKIWGLYGSIRSVVPNVIPHLNDNHRWTRPRIAVWVATQEAIYDPTPSEVAECPLEVSLPVPCEPSKV